MWPLIKKTPLRLQINPIECGAVALAIVLEYYGKKMPSSALNELVGVSRNGSDAQSLVKAAKLLGFNTKAQRGSVQDLRGQELAILFFDSCHFVVFEGLFAGRFYINDPASGRYALTREALRKRFSGVFITLSMAKTSALRRPHPFEFGRSIALFLYGLSAGLLFGLFTLALGALSVSGLSLGLGAGVVGLLFLSLALSLMVSSRFLELMSLVSEQQSADLMNALRQVRSSFFLSRPFVRFENVCQKLSTPTRDHRLYAFFLLGIAMVAFLMLWVMAWYFALAVLSAACLGALIVLKGRQNAYALGLELLKVSFEQSWNNYPDIEAMGQNAFLEQRHMEHEIKLLSKDSSTIKLSTFSLGTLPCLLWFSALFAIASSPQSLGFALAELVSITLLSSAIFYCSYRIAFNFEAHDASQDTASFMAELTSEAMSSALDPRPSDGALIAVKDASFRYAGESNPLFSSLNITIFPKRCYGVLGPPQAGTSTLLKLLAQKMPWTQGTMEFKSRHFAIIDEEAELFHGSLWDNLTLFHPHMGEQQVVAALYAAGIEELFLRRPLGLLSLIESHGKNISVGQKKRLLLARALVHQADLLVLDDFFATLDEPLAADLLTTLKTLPLTVIFSSWRASELAKTDQVIMLSSSGGAALRTHAEWLGDESYRALIGVGKAS